MQLRRQMVSFKTKTVNKTVKMLFVCLFTSLVCKVHNFSWQRINVIYGKIRNGCRLLLCFLPFDATLRLFELHESLMSLKASTTLHSNKFSSNAFAMYFSVTHEKFRIYFTQSS